MSAFETLNVAGSGLYTNRKWMDAVSDNIANINTAEPTSGSAFQARYIEAQSVNYGTGDGGVEVTGAAFGDPVGRVVYDPTNPVADAQGYVRMPDIDLGDQMTQLIQAQRSYQANLAVVQRATTAYQQALNLGKANS